MSVRRLSNSFISTEGRGKSSTLLAGYSPAIDEMDLIERITVGSGGAASIEFTDIPATYDHLQIRGLARVNSVNGGTPRISINNSTSSFTYHFLAGNGSSLTAGYNLNNYFPLGGQRSASWFVFVCNILEYTNTSKDKTLITNWGSCSDTAGAYWVFSNLWNSTSVVSSLKIAAQDDSFIEHSTMSIYGVK